LNSCHFVDTFALSDCGFTYIRYSAENAFDILMIKEELSVGTLEKESNIFDITVVSLVADKDI